MTAPFFSPICAHRLPLRPSSPGAAWSPLGAPLHLLNLRPHLALLCRRSLTAAGRSPIQYTMVLWAAPAVVSWINPLHSTHTFLFCRIDVGSPSRGSGARHVGGQGLGKDQDEGGAWLSGGRHAIVLARVLANLPCPDVAGGRGGPSG